MDFELQQLRVFAAVAEELHFGRAALRLGISQPQVSRHLRNLEDSLGVALFVRDPRRTELTAAGQALLSDARDTLTAVERLQRRAEAVAVGRAGQVTVGFLWSTLQGYLAPLVSASAERLPEVQLAVAQLRYVGVIDALRRGDVDLTITRPVRDESEMIARVLRREPSMLAIPDSHPLAGHDEIELTALDGQPLIALSATSVGQAFEPILAWLGERDIHPRIVHRAVSPSEALALVSAGLGVYQIPASARISQPGVTYRRIGDTFTRIVLMRRPEPPAPAVQSIIDLAVALFGDAFDASNDGVDALETVSSST